jgi:hypothetical protein
VAEPTAPIAGEVDEQRQAFAGAPIGGGPDVQVALGRVSVGLAFKDNGFVPEPVQLAARLGVVFSLEKVNIPAA